MGIVDSFVDGVKGFFGFGSGSQRTSSSATPSPVDHTISEQHPIHGEGKKSKGLFSSLPGGGGPLTWLAGMMVAATMMISPPIAALLGAVLFGPALMKGIGSLFSGSSDSDGSDQPTMSGGNSTRTPSLAGRDASPERTTETQPVLRGKPAQRPPLPSDGWGEGLKETASDWYHRATETVGAGPSTNRNVLRWVAPLDLNGKEQAHHLPTGLLASVMDQESRGIEGRRSNKNCEGLFQFASPTANELCIDRNHPEQAADGAARMLEQLAKKYNNNLEGMLAGYNWGQGNYDKWVKNGRHANEMPKETRDYITRVKALLPQYAEATTAIAGNYPSTTVAAAKQDVPAPTPSKPHLATLAAGVKNNGVTDGKDTHAPTASQPTSVAAAKPVHITL